MKTSSLFYTTMPFIFLSLVAGGQTAEKTFVKSFNPSGQEHILIDLPGNVQVKRWSNAVVQVQMNVQLDRGSNAQLKALARTGRYRLSSKLEGEDFVIFAPGLEKIIRINDQAVSENISYLIYLPGDINVQLTNETVENQNVDEIDRIVF